MANEFPMYVGINRRTKFPKLDDLGVPHVRGD